MMKYQAATIELGEDNEGAFGPTPEVEANFEDFVEAINNPDNYRKSNNIWICVDGRADLDEVEGDGEFAAAQVPGSLPIVNTAGDIMDETFDDEDLLLSSRIAANTQDAVAAGHKIIVHGDDHHGKEGCAANKQMRATLQKIAENEEIIAPLTLALCKTIGLDKWVEQEDIYNAITIAGRRSANDMIWDANSTQVAEIAEANGAEYHTLTGEHQEQAVVATLEGTYDTQKFAAEHATKSGRSELFGYSLGEYAKTTFADMVASGCSERDGALKAMRGILYTVGLCKKIGSPSLRVVALAP